jgi:glycosyltransferase involved in cell wall biosynthesis
MNSNAKRIHIGILFPQTKNGGYFQLALSIADSLLKCSTQYTYSLLVHDETMVEWLEYYHEHVKLIHVERNALHHKFCSIINILLDAHVLPASRKKQTTQLKKAGIDLLIIPFPALFGFNENIPYIVTISDVMYEYYPRTEKYLSFKNKILVKSVYKYAARYAVWSIADSDQGRDDIHRFLNTPKEKIRTIPLMPPGYIYRNQHMDAETAHRLLMKYHLPERFLFYPSQFCFDKNHLRLIQSLTVIKQLYGQRVPLVLTGLTGDSYRDVMNLIHASGMDETVRYLGFVTGEEIVALYKTSVALVFASICGPTSIPPVEAMILGTPLLYPNIFSMSDQVGEAGISFDPYNIEDMAEKIYRMWMDKNLRGDLVRKGYQQVNNLTQEKYAGLWERCIQDAMDTIR